MTALARRSPSLLLFSMIGHWESLSSEVGDRPGLVHLIVMMVGAGLLGGQWLDQAGQRLLLVCSVSGRVKLL